MKVNVNRWEPIISSQAKNGTGSALVMSQLCAPHLTATRGAIVNVSSIGAHPFMSSVSEVHETREDCLLQRPFYYSVSKSALDALTIHLAGNFIKQGVRVNSVR